MTRLDELRHALRRLMAEGRPADEIAEEIQNAVPGVTAQETMVVLAMLQVEKQIG
jgi:hypothetical protein